MGSSPTAGRMLRRNVSEPQQAADFHQMGAVEAQSFNAVFGGLRLAIPNAVGPFDEVVIEVFGTEIDEGNFDASELRRRPLDAFGSVADVAGPVEVVEIHAQVGEF